MGAAVEFQKNVNMSGLNKDISTKCGGQMHHGYMQMIAGTLSNNIQPTCTRSP